MLGPQAYFEFSLLDNFIFFQVYNGDSFEAWLPTTPALSLLLPRRLLPPPFRPRHHQPSHLHHHEQALQVVHTLVSTITIDQTKRTTLLKMLRCHGQDATDALAKWVSPALNVENTSLRSIFNI